MSVPRNTQKGEVLAQLRAARKLGEPVTGNQFLRLFIPRYSARIEELRQMGFVIETERIKASLFSYRLVYDPEQDTPNQQTQMEV